MPTNLYGPNDNFDIKTSHVIPAMIRKFHDAKINNSKNVELWGDGSPMREFMFVDDLSDAIFSICKNKMGSHIYNIGSGEEISISQLASLIKNITSYKGNVKWLKKMPNGTPRKLLNSNRIKKFGWNAKTDIINGIEKTYQWYVKNIIN
jgi:GDP-L-fucose synthase